MHIQKHIHHRRLRHVHTLPCEYTQRLRSSLPVMVIRLGRMSGRLRIMLIMIQYFPIQENSTVLVCRVYFIIGGIKNKNNSNILFRLGI